MEDKSVIACSIFFYFVGLMEISGIEMLNESKKRNLLNERLINGTLLLNSKKFVSLNLKKLENCQIRISLPWKIRQECMKVMKLKKDSKRNRKKKNYKFFINNVYLKVSKGIKIL